MVKLFKEWTTLKLKVSLNRCKGNKSRCKVMEMAYLTIICSQMT